MATKFEVVRAFKGASGMTVGDFAQLLMQNMAKHVISTHDILVVSDGVDTIRPVVGAAKGEVKMVKDPSTGVRTHRFQAELAKGTHPRVILLRTR